MKIDIGFDVRSDSDGKDPDFASKTLRQYHQFLWSKPLPSGEKMELQYVPSAYHYLIFEFKSGTMFLSSDSTTTSMSFHKKLAPIVTQIPKKEIEHFQTVGSTIGAKFYSRAKRSMDIKQSTKLEVFPVKSKIDSTSHSNA